MSSCFHCGEDCASIEIKYEDKSFCCNGCRMVYDILNENGLTYYYELEQAPGVSPVEMAGKFDFLENEAIVEKLLEFDEGGIQIVSFLIPSIHCSSCIWVLENLNKLHPAIQSSLVDFPKRTVRITYTTKDFSISKLVRLLSRIGYEPNISLENYEERTPNVDRTLIYQLGVAGFAFGNVMFLSFPEYFDLGPETAGGTEFWLEEYKNIFRWLMFAFSVPVVFYSGKDYFISAFKGLRSRILNIDVPIALGITVLFIRSTLDIAFDWGSGFFDSLTGLIFFLLLGKFFQKKTYAFLSFERDYKSYFPIAVTRLKKDTNEVMRKPGEDAASTSEEQIPLYEIKTGDRVLIRNEEIIPMDGILRSGNGWIDYSFVTGEAAPVSKRAGEKLYAGGKQRAGSIEVEVLKPVEQSYLTQLWGNEIFDKGKRSPFETLTDRISGKFTISVLSIAFLAALFWAVYDPSKVFNVFTAVLIVACPCAIALAAPFTLGNLLRIFGVHRFYLKEASVLEKMAKVDTVVFDKTGTLTTHKKNNISYEGVALSEEEKIVLSSTLRASNHPLSRALYAILDENDICTLDEFDEQPGKGITATGNSKRMKIGSLAFVDELKAGNKHGDSGKTSKTTVHISSDDNYKGRYVFHNEYREGVDGLFGELVDKELVVLSGDNEGEKDYLKRLIPNASALLFGQKPEDKLNYIKSLQQQGKRVLMVGDGLNDAGALAQSDVGVVLAENINVFSPASDAILDASMFTRLPLFLEISKKGISVIKWSFVLSLAYNLIGLGFAVTGLLEPVIAAILMPLSSISIVVFTTIMSKLVSRGLSHK